MAVGKGGQKNRPFYLSIASYSLDERLIYFLSSISSHIHRQADRPPKSVNIDTLSLYDTMMLS